MSLFSYDEVKQKEAIESFYNAITAVFKQAIIVPKYREGLYVIPLSKNKYEIPEIDTVELMNGNYDEYISLFMEFNSPINISNISYINSLSDNILNDSNYLLIKQQVEAKVDVLVRAISSSFKATATASIIDIIDNGEILWQLELTIRVGR